MQIGLLNPDFYSLLNVRMQISKPEMFCITFLKVKIHYVPYIKVYGSYIITCHPVLTEN